MAIGEATSRRGFFGTVFGGLVAAVVGPRLPKAPLFTARYSYYSANVSLAPEEVVRIAAFRICNSPHFGFGFSGFKECDGETLALIRRQMQDATNEMNRIISEEIYGPHTWRTYDPKFVLSSSRPVPTADTWDSPDAAVRVDGQLTAGTESALQSFIGNIQAEPGS